MKELLLSYIIGILFVCRYAFYTMRILLLPLWPESKSINN